MTEATETQPTIRVRIAHVHTLKDGWRLSETTVEYTGTLVDWPVIEAEMANAYRNGLREANYRNSAEAAS